MVDFLNSNARFDGLFNGETVSSGPSQLSLGSGDSLSSSVHCAPDENDWPSEQTLTFKLLSVYVPVYISELTRT